MTVQEAESKYKQMFDNPFVGIALHEAVDEGKDFVLVDFNRTAEGLTGKKSNEVLGRRVTEVFPCIEDVGLMDVLRSVYATGKPMCHPPSPYVHSSGEKRWYESYVYKLSSGEIVVVFMDRTDLKRIEKEKEELIHQLYQAQKMESIGKFAAAIAHDFNNMLNVILGYGEIVLNKLHEQDPLRPHVEKIVDAAKRSADLTRQLLTFSRKRPIQRQLVDLNDVVDQMRGLIERLIGENIELETRLSPSGGPVVADRSQLEQVIMNLVANARDAMPDGGRLFIKTAPVVLDEEFTRKHHGTVPGKYMMLAVTDTGCGMSRDVMDRIFEPFFTTKEKGTGFGLSTVYGVVRQLGGSIWVYSEPGKGTTFKIYLPLAEKAEMPEPVHEDHIGVEISEETVKKHILVVEDEDLLRDFIEKILEELGYWVTTAANPREAISLVRDKGIKPDLLITDLVMPEMSGKKLAEYLKELQPDMKVIYMSGYTDDVVSYHGLDWQEGNFLEKPFSVKDLAEKIRRALD